MKLAILYPQTKDIVEYTASVLRYVAERHGHEITSPDDADIVCVSVCDVTQVAYVDKIRKKYPTKKIAVGGHAAIYYKLFGMFADYVNIGQGFDFFSCHSIEQIEALSCVWTRGKERVISSTTIDWRAVPVSNVTHQQRYYWGAVGCKNKCAFCLTSWTNPHQKNNPILIGSVLKKYPNTTIVTNDSDEIPSRMTQSIMLVDFLTKPLKKYAVYRMGIEFATEETRKRYGKPFSDDMFVAAIMRAVHEGVRLKLFCIGGINSKDEWRALFSSVPPIYQKGNFVVKMTNVIYDMFVPLKRERYNIDYARMWRTPEVKAFVSGLKLSGGWGFHSLPCATPEDTMIKNALCFTTNPDEYAMVKRLAKCSADQIQTALIGLFANDYSDTVKIDHRVSIDR